jgi:outer membrane protein TolC
MVNYLILLAISSIPIVHARNLQLSETLILNEAQKGSPKLDEIEAAWLASQSQKGELNDFFSPELFGQSSYAETNERPIITFIPIFSPIKQSRIGMRKNFEHGLSTEFSAGTDQRSGISPTGKYRNVTTTSLALTMQLDLWKDLFGKLSKARLANLELESKKAKLEKSIQTKSYLISLRRIFWSLVANQEAIRFSTELLSTARTQALETIQRYKKSVAEADEVARYEAQVASREGTLTFLNYQKETLLKQLKTLLPQLQSDQLELGQYDLDKTFDQIMSCTALIASRADVPYEYTHYDETISLLKESMKNFKALNSGYASPDVKLYGSVRSTGVGSDQTAQGFRGSYGASIDDMSSNNRSGYEVGVRVAIPLGSSKEQTQKTKELYDEKRLLAMIHGTDSRVINSHVEFVRSVKLLDEVIKAQKMTSAKLLKRLTFMKKKYQQARASVNDLVQDQDALLTSELSTIDTKLQIVNVVFDYFSIFTETPCEFNRI